MRYEAIPFDMDGVVVDTEQSVTRFWRRIAALHGVALSDEDLQRYVYGRPANATLDTLFPHLTRDDREAVHAAMHEQETRDTYQAVPGVVTFLRTLRRHEIPAALVTSGEPWKVQTVLAQLDVAGLFAAQVTARDITAGKPHPQCYLLGAHAIGVAADHCLVFEDAVSGVEAAVAAGAVCIGVARPGREHALGQAGAQFIIPNFSALAYRSGMLDLGNGAALPLRPASPGSRYT